MNNWFAGKMGIGKGLSVMFTFGLLSQKWLWRDSWVSESGVNGEERTADLKHVWACHNVGNVSTDYIGSGT
jgi:hypothetical protein